jgi:hypothetical protein
MKVNEGLPTELWKRYDKLNAKFRKGKITEIEHEELLRLNDNVELYNATLLENLTKLARLRKQPIDKLMNGLEIKNLKV